MPYASLIALFLQLPQDSSSLIFLPALGYELPEGFAPIIYPKLSIEFGIHQVLNKCSLSQLGSHLVSSCNELTKHMTYFIPH